MKHASAESDGDRANDGAPAQAALGTVNWSVALEATGGDRRLLIEILHAFREETPRLMVDVQSALAVRDAALLQRAAHTIKNSMYTLGASATGDVAYAVETMGRSSRFEDAHQLVPTLEKGVAEVMCETDRYLQCCKFS